MWGIFDSVVLNFDKNSGWNIEYDFMNWDGRMVGLLTGRF